METEEGSLISVDEASEATKLPKVEKRRLAVLIFAIGGLVIAISFIAMILLSLKGARTGIESIFPFLEKKQDKSLKEPAK